MGSHFDFSDEEFLSRFQDCSLDSDLFTHEAHLRLVWICLEKFGAKKTEELVPEMIQKYVTHLGAQDKFHLTLTIASVKVVNLFRTRTKTSEFIFLLEKHTKLKDDFKSLIAQYYSLETINCAKAKEFRLEPDLAPFK